MKKQVNVTLFGKNGKRTLKITTLGGFFTRGIKAPRELVSPSPSEKPASVSPKPEAGPPSRESENPPTLLEVLRYMETSADYTDWLIIDEILFIATAMFKMKFNHTTLLDALRELFKEGFLVYRQNRFGQHTFRLIEKQVASHTLKNLLAEADALTTYSS